MSVRGARTRAIDTRGAGRTRPARRLDGAATRASVAAARCRVNLPAGGAARLAAHAGTAAAIRCTPGAVAPTSTPRIAAAPSTVARVAAGAGSPFAAASAFPRRPCVAGGAATAGCEFTSVTRAMRERREHEYRAGKVDGPFQPHHDVFTFRRTSRLLRRTMAGAPPQGTFLGAMTGDNAKSATSVRPRKIGNFARESEGAEHDANLCPTR